MKPAPSSSLHGGPRLTIIVLSTALGALWLYLRGPVPIIRFTTVLDQPMSNWYTISAFPVLGMLCADLLAWYRVVGLRVRTIELGVQLALLVALSGLRLGVRIPLSGHVVLLVYFIARRLLVNGPPNPLGRAEVALAGAVLAAVAYGKLVWWDDPHTLWIGAVAGVLLAAGSRAVARGSMRRGSRVREHSTSDPGNA